MVCFGLIPTGAVALSCDLVRSIYGVLFWAPLLIDAMLQGQFSGVHSAKPAPPMTAKETVRCSILQPPDDLGGHVIQEAGEGFRCRVPPCEGHQTHTSALSE